MRLLDWRRSNEVEIRLQVPCLCQDVAKTSICVHNAEHVYVAGDNKLGDGKTTACVWSAAGICGVVTDD